MNCCPTSGTCKPPLRKELQAAVCYGESHVTQSRIRRRLCRGSGSFHCRLCPGGSIRHCRGSQGHARESSCRGERGQSESTRHVPKGEGGFKDRDLYVWCANASDGILTAHPTNKGKELRDIEGKHGAPFGQEIMQTVTEGTIKEVTYWWPRPGSDKPLEKKTFYTKAGDQVCGVGYYKG
jgi:hypothetical protein